MPNRRKAELIGPYTTPEQAFAAGYRPSGVLDDQRKEQGETTTQSGWIYAIAALIGGAALWRFLRNRS